MNHALKSALANFTRQGSELVVGGKTVSALAEQYGTPLYIYDKRIILQKCQVIRNALPDNLKIYYALKANPNHEIIQLMAGLYDGFDVASAGEIERVIQAGIAPDRISFAGPGKTISELRYAINQQIGGLSLESEQEFGHVKAICRQLGKTADVFIRVNPDFGLSQSGMKMGGGPTQFGVDSERVPDLLKAIQDAPLLNFKGIHIFSGSQNLSADELLRLFENIFDYAVSLIEVTGIAIDKLNMGGGFGIPYFAHEQELDLLAVGQGLERLFRQYRAKLKNTSFIIELGRFLVGESGVYLTRVLYRKISQGQVFLVTDGGMHHHLAASGNFGQSLVRRPMPLTVANRLGGPVEKVHVVGPLCTPLDSFGFVDLPEAQQGDLIAVLNSGAYGFSASPQLFLSHPAPKEIIV
ncbi:L-glutamyl-[BtrI acyl-carrier protein] decarboxylase [bacterium BMS3Bbin14]|nr:L-glutamyl-[BtrI acyl-carrier protein] decarboxylase [bacterium BMS3Bbin14]HDL98284.1 pyridoxal-dependent decarboxylase, exosortase A system-associated [Desulfobacteraceae bacterium]HDO30363.1 pyridoxal-dependent decarboxylase, exosortase A system-associated [Desulfobacteraceae bacterium]